MRVREAFFCAVAVVLPAVLLPAVLLPAAAPALGEVRKIPVFNVEGDRLVLQMEVEEGTPNAGPTDYPLAAGGRPAAAPPDVAAVLRYFEVLARGRLDLLPALYADGADPAAARQAAAFYRRLLRALPGGAGTLRLERTWHFASYRVLVVRLLAADDDTSRRLTVSLEEDAGAGFRRRDEWGRWQQLHQLLWYAASHIDAGLGQGPPGSFNDAVRFAADGGGPALTVEFDSVRFDRAAPWAPAGAAADPRTPRGFAHHAMNVADGDDESAFVELWNGEERRKLATARVSHRPLFGGARNPLRGLGEVRDVVTLALGDHAVHYFVTRDAPADLRALTVQQTDDGYLLSKELPTNLRTFLGSEIFRRALSER